MARKRFGRNQKRKLKETILDLQNKVNSDSIRINNLYSSIAYYENKLNNLIQLIEKLCKFSIAVPVKTKKVSNIRSRYDEVFYHTDNIPLTYENIYPNNILYTPITLYKLETCLINHADKLTSSIHLRYSNGTSSAYSISEEGLANMPTETLRDYFAPEIAELLIEHLKRQF